MKAELSNHSPQFKAQVALEAIQGVKTIPEIATEHGLDPEQVSAWQKAFMEGVAEVFIQEGAQSDRKEREREDARLRSKISLLAAKVESLQGEAKQLGIWDNLPDWSKKLPLS